jgi:3-hydroxyisobutyrate dehydrogenase-like beta-hydroxyacid dehydrogenase
MTGIGWIGLGNMGVPMSKNLLKAGYDVVVYNRTKKKAGEVLALGAKWVDTPAEVAKQVSFIFTMIADDDALKAVYFGEEGILSKIEPGKIIIDMSTVSPEASFEVNKTIESNKCKFLRAPVTGGPLNATAGTLGIMCSGDKEAYKKVLDYFKAISKNQFYLGGGEEARYMKLIINMMLANTMQMMAESLVLGKKAGLDWVQMLEVISRSAVASPVVEYKAKAAMKRDFSVMLSTRLMAKDLDLALAIAKKLDVPIPITAMTRQFLASAHAIGMAEKDFSSLILVAEELSGIKE